MNSMSIPRRFRLLSILSIPLSGALWIGAVGCASPLALADPDPVASPPTTAKPAPDVSEIKQKTFASPEDAVKALTDAAKAADRATTRMIFGPMSAEVVSDDDVQAGRDFQVFATAVGEMTNLVKGDDGRCVLFIGKENWPFPIPLARNGDGKWFFDTAAGKEEILNRRIGADELATIEFVRSYVDAQREYAEQDHTGNEVLKYAQRLGSTAAQKDGLYWPSVEGEPESPLGVLAAKAMAEGYGAQKGKVDAQPEPYHGYYFKILTKQGENSPGGKYGYVINGNMIGGFALVAFPSKYNSSGIMTFVVNQQGKVYQKDLGDKTGETAAAMTEYDPDKTWTLVKE
jgi:Protein of unknown function (DUF2950)